MSNISIKQVKNGYLVTVKKEINKQAAIEQLVEVAGQLLFMGGQQGESEIPISTEAKLNGLITEAAEAVTDILKQTGGIEQYVFATTEEVILFMQHGYKVDQQTTEAAV